MRAELVLDGEVVAKGGSFTLGQELASESAIEHLTDGWSRAFNHPIAGEYQAFWLDLQGFGRAPLDDLAIRTPDQLLHRAAKAYFINLDMSLKLMHLAGIALGYRLPSFGTIATSLTPYYVFGVPREVRLDGLLVDMDAVSQSLVSLAPDQTSDAELQKQLGARLSALEHEIPAFYLGSPDAPTASVSAVAAIALALDQGQALHEVDTDNQAAVLAFLDQDPAVERDIRDAVQAGLTAYVHEASIAVGAWQGSGYLLLDPATGSGAYRISGGTNGAASSRSDFAAGLSLFGLGVLGRHLMPPSQADINAALTDCEGGTRSRVRVPVWESLALVIIMIILGRGLRGIPKMTPNPGPAMAAVTNFAIVTNAARATQAGKVCPVYLSGYYSASGGAMFEVTDNIEDSSGPRFLTYMGPDTFHDRDWLLYTETCSKSARALEVARRGALVECDEYPFANALEGGEEHKDWVSLRLVLARHNHVQGGTLRQFVRKCRLAQNDRYKVETWNGTTKYYTGESMTTECP